MARQAGQINHLRAGRGFGEGQALEILRQRYARGEIDKQEFDTRRRDLGH